MDNNSHLATQCIHTGELANDAGMPHTPVYNSTTFAFDSTADLLDVVEGRCEGSLYTRYGFNPSIRSLESKLAALEKAEAALAFSSGMAAESAVFLSHGREGILCIGDAYGGTLELLEKQLPLLDIPTWFLLGTELDQLEHYLQQGVRLVFFETPSNPVLEIFDIADIARRVHAYGAILVIDNTFATPVNQQPLGLGADLVIHSATKYLGGHSDITAGALMGSAVLIEPVFQWRKNLGQTPSPEVASLLSRSLRTLVVRVQQQNANAMHIARALLSHHRIKRVLYPGLDNFPGHALASRQMNGFGGMLSIEIDGTREQTSAIVDRLKLFKIAPSLGGVESLVTQPVTTTHHGLDEEERKRRGISDAMIRLSVGLEDVHDLLADIEQAVS
ncbi:MAG TPA: aminotransferase class I/II-fold pyridoxal phosphate-dependent enzyme [Gammaproteobacteria bacterium]|nr:aminotransferase class I/II-fold pyridoxal phosphate-dependent enzyme [Gammaproteobacteria bacterium]